MKMMNDIFFKNLTWKIVSLLFAIALWLIGININDPVESVTFTVRLSMENKDRITSNDFVISNQDTLDATNIRVTISASRSRLNAIKASNIKAYIDLRPIDYTYVNKLGENQALTVYPQLVGNVDSSYYQLTSLPHTVNLVLDKLITTKNPILVDRKGDPASGYIAMKQMLSVENVSITGARQAINQIDSVRVEVDLKDAAGDIVIPVQPRVYNSDNKDITSLFVMEPEEITLTIPINMYAKLPVNPTFIGEVAEGYTITSVTQDLEYVEVVGSKEDIDSITSINLSAVNIEGLSGTKIFPYDLRNYLMSSNLSIRNGTPHELNITVNIEQEAERLIEIPMEKLNILGMNSNVDISNQGEIEFMVKGNAELIGALVPEDILCVLDLSGREAGIHFVEVELTLPDGVRLIDEKPTVEVTILEEASNDDSETEEDATPMPTGTTEPSGN